MSYDEKASLHFLQIGVCSGWKPLPVTSDYATSPRRVTAFAPRRITRRLALLKLDGMDNYVGYLRDHKEEVERLYQDILIRVTGFFRDPETFEVLKEKVFPELVRQRADDGPLRFWVLGCSTGEEAYSIAIAASSRGRTC